MPSSPLAPTSSPQRLELLLGKPVSDDAIYGAASTGDLDAVTDILADSWPDGSVLNETLARACAAGSLPVVMHLLLHGAAIEPAKPLMDVPLFCASGAGHVAIASELLKRSAQIDRAASSGETALSCAASCGHTAVVELLLHHKASLDASAANGEFGDATPLQRAEESWAAAAVEIGDGNEPARAGDWAGCIRLLKAAEEARAIQLQRSGWRKVEKAISVWPYARYFKAWYDERKGKRSDAQNYDERTEYDHSSIYKPDDDDDDEPSYTRGRRAPSVPPPATMAPGPPPPPQATEPAPATAPSPTIAQEPSPANPAAPEPGELGLSGELSGLPAAQPESAESATPSYNGPPIPKLASDFFRTRTEAEDADGDPLLPREEEELAPIQEGDEDDDGSIDFDEAESPRPSVLRPFGLAELPLGQLPMNEVFDEVSTVEEDPTARSAGGSSSGIE